MTESEFETLAGDALAALERAFEAAVAGRRRADERLGRA